MRIAVAYDCFFPVSTGGGERQYRLFAETWLADGHDVTYLTRRQWEGPAPDLGGGRVLAVSGPSELYDGRGNRRLPPALAFAWGLGRHLVRHRREYDVVVVSALPVLNVLVTRLALLGSGVPWCADFLEVWRPEQWREYSGAVVGRVASALQRVAARTAPWVSCHSQMNGDRLRAAGARRPPVVSPGLIHGEVSADWSRAAQQPPTVVYAGRHIPDKQVEAIPAAVAWARGSVPDLQAVILGEGATTAGVVAEVERLGLTDVVRVPGFVSQEQLDHLLAGAACLVNPSRREGYGLVVVEAAAHGTPSVLVDAPDNASVELVEPGVNGAKAESTAPDQLGAAIVDVVARGPQLRTTTREWYERAVTERTVEAAARGILRAVTSPTT